MSPAVQLRLILPGVSRLDLDEDERDALLSTLRQIVDNDRFPLSPRIPMPAPDPREYLELLPH